MASSGHSNLVAIILSGGGTDGSVGVKDVKEVGCLILIQHPDDTEYDSMLRAAINTGLADVILPVNQSATVTRNLSIDISPAVLRGDGLADALTWLDSQMQDQYGLEVSIHPNGVSSRVEDTLRILLFQAVREALFNVVKHGEISRAEVSFSSTDAEVQITISDDGSGFGAAAMLNESQRSGGLMNIRHRPQLMGCELEVRSQRGAGTRVVLRVPAEQVKP